MKTLTNIIYPLLAAIALSAQARATCQDACLTNGNTVQGDDALVNNTTGDWNTVIGFQGLLFNTTGYQNTATGYQALWSNTTGAANTATGVVALFSNTTGNDNTATGGGALGGNTTGYFNTASGALSLQNNTTGIQSTANGAFALLNNTTGSSNIALGFQAGMNLTTGRNNIDIGNNGVAAESNTIRIGTSGTQRRTFVAGISGVTVSGGAAVYVKSNGQLGTITSSGRFKEAIRPMDKTSEAILSLQPVTFRYKKELDPAATPQFGLVAEDVAKVNPDLVARDEEGRPYTVRYEAVNAMLLNEFLKAHKKAEEEADRIEQLEAALKQQAAQLQAVTARIDAKGL